MKLKLSNDGNYLYGVTGGNSGANPFTLFYKRKIDFTTVWEVMYLKDYMFWDFTLTQDDDKYILYVPTYSSGAAPIIRLKASDGSVDLTVSINSLTN